VRQNPRHWSDITIRNLPLPESGSQKLFDPSLPGFGIRLTARSRTFIVQYGKERTVRTIGQYPDFSLKDARKAALAILDAPATKSVPQSTTASIRAFLDDCQARLRPSTVERYRFALRTVPDAPLDTYKPTTNDPNELKALKAFYNWCIDHELTERNPVARRTVVFNQRDRVLTDTEVARLLRYNQPPYSALVHLLLLSGQRRNQFAQFDPAWVRDGCIHFPASVMKTKRAHTIPLTAHMAMLVPALRPMSGWSKMKARMDRETGVTEYVLHDARRYVSTTMAKLGVLLPVTEFLLDHRASTSGVQAVYMRHTFLPEMREALMTFERHLATILDARA
jgi:integrase